MKIFNVIKKWIVETYYFIYLDIIGFQSIQYKYLYLNIDKKIDKYIEKIALELCEKENLKVYYVRFDDLNNDLKIVEEINKAVGCFRYIDKDKMSSYKDKISSYYKNYNSDTDFDTDTYTDILKNKKYVVPRIEISEKGDVFTLIHELGHYFIYKRDTEQSEDFADAYLDEFFNENLPPFFKWIYQIHIEVIVKKDIKYSSLDSYNYFKEYKQWIKNNPEYS